MAKITSPLISNYEKKSGYTGTAKLPYDLSYGKNLPAYEAPKVPSLTGGEASYGSNFAAGSIGGVTKEGVITGGSPNMERMPTINNGASGKIDLSYGTNKSFLSDRINQMIGSIGSSVRKPSTSGGTQSGGTTAPPTPSAPTTPTTKVPSAQEMGVMTYEEYLESQSQSYQDDYEKMQRYYEDQNAAETERINAEKAAAEAEAAKQRQLLLDAAEKAKNTAYTEAEKQLMSDLNYTETQYQALVDAINAEKESGAAMAEEKRQLLLDMSQKQRDTIYAAAEAQREQEYANAEIERERGIVDARSSYAQNKSSYGANAEALASMGLTGSGYGEYMDSAAYAQQRAETQQANAQSEASKRQARYTESQQKLSADQEHAQNQYNAEMQYLQDKHDVDSTYRSNMLTAEQERASGKKSAEDKARQTKYEADQQYDSNSYAANSAYSSAMREADQNARDSKAASDKETAAGKLSADLNYSSNIRGLEDKVQEKKQNEQDYARNAYYELLDKANAGSYTEDQIKQLAKDYGLSDEQTKSLTEAANAYAEKHDTTGDANTYQNYMNMKENADYLTDGDIDKAVKSGLITKEDGAALKSQREKLSTDEIQSYIDSGDIASAQAYADKAYQDGKISKDAYNKAYFDAWIKNCEGATTADEAKDIEADLKKLKSAGKITDADYNSIIKHMYSSMGKTLSSGSYSVSYDKNVFGTELPNAQCLRVTVGGKTYKLETNNKSADEETSALLERMFGSSPKHGTMTKLGDQLYIYRTYPSNSPHKSGWEMIKKYNFWTSGWGTDNKDFYEQYEKLYNRQAKPSTPSHAADDGADSSNSLDTSYKNNGGGYTQAVDSTGRSSNFIAIQEYINKGNYREGDRARWGEAFRHGSLPDGRNVLDVYRLLSDEEKKALKGTTDTPK